jgi:polar amino acid transport system substrate-binding protein
MQHLREGTGFALFPPYMNLIDEPWTWPYSLPLFQEKVVAMCREDIMTKPRPKWPEDYYGLTIGNNAGFIVGGAEFDKAVKEGKMKMQEAKDNEANVMKLALKRLDCYINDKLSILWTLNQLKKAGTYDEKAGHAKIVEGTTIAVEHGFLGYTDRDKGAFPFKTDFAKKFDTIIYQMYRRGEIERIGKEFMQSD